MPERTDQASMTLQGERVEWVPVERGVEVRDPEEPDAWLRIRFHADRTRGSPSVPVCPDCLAVLPASGRHARCPDCGERIGGD